MHNPHPAELSPESEHRPPSSLKERRVKVDPWRLECHSILAELAGLLPTQDKPEKLPYYSPLNEDALLRLTHLRPYADVVLRDGTMQVINNWKVILLARARQLREISVRIVNYSDDDLPGLIYLDIMTHIQSIPDGKPSLFKKRLNEALMTRNSDLLKGPDVHKLRAFLPVSSAHRLTGSIPGSKRGRRKR